MGVHDGNYKAAKKALGIPADEPIFVIRAQDDLSTAALARYRNFAEGAGCSDEFVDGLDEVVREFEGWRQDHPTLTKKPD